MSHGNDLSGFLILLMVNLIAIESPDLVVKCNLVEY